MQTALPDPGDPTTFRTLQAGPLRARGACRRATPLHHDLLRCGERTRCLRPRSAASTAPCSRKTRSFCETSRDDGDDRLLLVNLGRDLLHMRTMPEPLLAPPATGRWTVLWSRKTRVYGGGGLPALAPSMERGLCRAIGTVLLSSRKRGKQRMTDIRFTAHAWVSDPGARERALRITNGS